MKKVEKLTPKEKKRLEELEKVMRSGYISRCNALREIKATGLYREKYQTFEKYAEGEWELHKSHAHRLVRAADVIEHLEKTKRRLPANESQAIQLAEYVDNYEALDAIWEVALASGKVTAKLIEEVANNLYPEKGKDGEENGADPTGDGNAAPQANAKPAGNAPSKKYKVAVTAKATEKAIAALAKVLAVEAPVNSNIGNFKKEVAADTLFEVFADVGNWVVETQPQSFSLDVKEV